MIDWSIDQLTQLNIFISQTSEDSPYAHLLPFKQENRTSADLTETTPTYVNQMAMHEYVNVHVWA